MAALENLLVRQGLDRVIIGDYFSATFLLYMVYSWARSNQFPFVVVHTAVLAKSQSTKSGHMVGTRYIYETNCSISVTLSGSQKALADNPGDDWNDGPGIITDYSRLRPGYVLQLFHIEPNCQ